MNTYAMDFTPSTKPMLGRLKYPFRKLLIIFPHSILFVQIRPNPLIKCVSFGQWILSIFSYKYSYIIILCSFNNHNNILLYYLWGFFTTSNTTMLPTPFICQILHKQAFVCILQNIGDGMHTYVCTYTHWNKNTHIIFMCIISLLIFSKTIS